MGVTFIAIQEITSACHLHMSVSVVVVNVLMNLSVSAQITQMTGKFHEKSIIYKRVSRA